MIVPDPAAPPPETPRLQRFARLALVVGLIGLGAWTLQNFIVALIWAAIIAVAIGPAYDRARHHWPAGRHNIVLPLVATALVSVIFLLPFVLLGFQAARDAHDLLTFTSDALHNGIPVPDVVARLPFGGAAVSRWWQENVAEPTGLADLVHRGARGLVENRSRELGIAVTHRVVTFFFSLLALFFILRGRDRLKDDGLKAVNTLFGPSGERIARQMVSSVHGTVDGLVLVGLGEGVLMGIAYALAGVPHATLLGALTAVAAMVPFMILVALAAVGLVLLGQGAVGAAIAVLAFGLVMNFIADHFVRPGLIGGATQLPFLWVLLGVLGGVETWGLVGLFIGPALMSALILLWRELVRPEPLLDAKPKRPGAALSPAAAART